MLVSMLVLDSNYLVSILGSWEAHRNYPVPFNPLAAVVVAASGGGSGSGSDSSNTGGSR